MLNSIMMSNAPLRPIFIFAISKQILPTSQYSLQINKERGKYSNVSGQGHQSIIDPSPKFYIPVFC